MGKTESLWHFCALWYFDSWPTCPYLWMGTTSNSSTAEVQQPYPNTPIYFISNERCLLLHEGSRVKFCFFLSRAAPAAYESSQARGQIGAAAASLCRSHSNTSEPHLWPTPQLMATPELKGENYDWGSFNKNLRIKRQSESCCCRLPAVGLLRITEIILSTVSCQRVVTRQYPLHKLVCGNSNRWLR